jgi:hypothetical protein
MSLLAAGLHGCASVSTTPADPKSPPDGIRVHPTRVYLFVDNEKSRSHVVYAPDPESAYDVKPTSFLAEHDFKLDIDAGQVKSLTSNANPAAVLALFREATDIAAGAGIGRGTTDTTLEGTFGLEDGIYVLQNGRFEKVSPARPVRNLRQGERTP